MLIVIFMVVLILWFWFKCMYLGFYFGRFIFGWGGVMLMFVVVVFIFLLDVIVISFLNFVIGMLFVIFLLGEWIGKWCVMFVIIVFVGVMFLICSGVGVIEFGVFLVLGLVVFLGVELIFIKLFSGCEGLF